jgi:hypothetical protein
MLKLLFTVIKALIYSPFLKIIFKNTIDKNLQPASSFKKEDISNTVNKSGLMFIFSKARDAYIKFISDN